MARVAKLPLASRILLFQHLHAALRAFRKIVSYIFYFYVLQSVEIL